MSEFTEIFITLLINTRDEKTVFFYFGMKIRVKKLLSMVKTEFFFKSRKIIEFIFLDFLDHRFYMYYFDIIIYLYI